MKHAFPEQIGPELRGPAAIAFSGGGDSTAMIHAFRDHPSVRHVFIIDHALRAGSAKETAQAADIAKSYGYHVQIDRWEHEAISSGIQAKARDYRYFALGRMCRAAGLENLMTAHTADDQAETLVMRLNRQTGWRGLAGMPDSAYAPLWPELAGVTLHRPWLTKSRAELRDYNRRHGLYFIDDPSNENPDFTRIKARQALSADPELRADLLTEQKNMRARLTQERRELGVWLNAHAVLHPQGYIETNSVPPAELLPHLLSAAGGRGGPIDAVKCLRLQRDMTKTDFKAATLSGAWVTRIINETAQQARHGFVFLRDRVAVTGRSDTAALQSTSLNLGALVLWDGRFFCRAKQAGLRIETGLGCLQKLRQLAEFKALFELPKDVRESLPIYFRGDEAVGFGACDTENVTSIAASALRLQAMFGETHSVSI